MLLDVENEAGCLPADLNQHCVIGENFDPAAMKSIHFSLIHPCWLVEHNPWKGVLCMVLAQYSVDTLVFQSGECGNQGIKSLMVQLKVGPTSGKGYHRICFCCFAF